MVRPTKQTQHSDLKAAIIATAWAHISTTGAAMLSLRAIARDLQISAPAIYHYYPDRDALVTALIIESYTSLADHQFHARDTCNDGDIVALLQATGTAYRDWALAHPQHYQLIFGTPLPGYHTPVAAVRPAAARSLGVLIQIIEQARRAGRLNVAHAPILATTHTPEFVAWQQYTGAHHLQSLVVAQAIWGRLHGLVSLELSCSMPLFAATAEALYNAELAAVRWTYLRAERVEI